MFFLKNIITLLRNVAGEFVDSTKEYLYDFFKQLYIFALLSLFCILSICFSVTSLIVKIANKLDEGLFYWMNSMTVYSVIAILSIGFFYYLNIYYQIKTSTQENEIKEIIKKYNKKKNKTRRLK